MRKIIFISLVLWGVSCAQSKQTNQKQISYSIPDIYATYKSEIRGNTLVLTKSNQTTPKMPVRFLNLVLFDSSTNEVFFNEQIREGHLSWIDMNKIKISYTPGNPEKGQDYFYFYDLKTRQKIYSNTLQKNK